MRIFSILLLLIIGFSAQAQDPRYSQFYNGPLHLNPAMIGVFEGSYRLNANYRNQFASILENVPFRTIGASMDYRFRIVKDDFIALGVNFMQDDAGTARYSQTKAHLGFSYMKQLNGNRYRTSGQYLVVGAQIGFGQNSLNWSQLWFGRQWDAANNSINTTLDNGENINDRSNVYPDFNAGLMWYALYDDNKSIYAGAAMHHINSPNISFITNNNAALYRRYTGHAGGEFPLSDQLTVLPAVVLMSQGPSLETVLGTSFRYNNHDWREVALRIGGFVRLANMRDSGIGSESFITTMMLEMDKLNFGISYDFNISSLSKATNSRGAFELSVIYIASEKRRYKVSCPKL